MNLTQTQTFLLAILLAIVAVLLFLIGEKVWGGTALGAFIGVVVPTSITRTGGPDPRV